MNRILTELSDICRNEIAGVKNWMLVGYNQSS